MSDLSKTTRAASGRPDVPPAHRVYSPQHLDDQSIYRSDGGSQHAGEDSRSETSGSLDDDAVEIGGDAPPDLEAGRVEKTLEKTVPGSRRRIRAWYGDILVIYVSAG